MKKSDKKELFSIPNIMGYFRILLIPIFCVIYLSADSLKNYYIAAGVIIISTITDFLDGFVARKFNMITEFGKFLDPLADKLTHGAIAICLISRYPYMKYLVILMIIKESLMVGMGLINFIHHKKLDGAKWFGKICTTCLFFTLFLFVIYPLIPQSTANVVIIADIVIMMVTLILYIPEFYKLSKTWNE